MVAKSDIGHTWNFSNVAVEEGRIRFFAQAIGATDPLHTDRIAAKAAGYGGIVAPPTFALVMEVDHLPPERMLADLNVNIARVLHGEQGFTYHRPICAGNVLNVQVIVRDVYEKKGGAMTFIEVETNLTNEQSEPVVDMKRIIIVRN